MNCRLVALSILKSLGRLKDWKHSRLQRFLKSRRDIVSGQMAGGEGEGEGDCDSGNKLDLFETTISELYK
jgi:hypothetical protein